MTREKAKEFLKVIEEWIDGKTLQYRPVGTEGWKTYGSFSENHSFLSFNVLEFEWRIKPEPREWWLCGGLLYRSREGAEKCHPWHKDGPGIIHVKEVLDD